MSAIALRRPTSFWAFDGTVDGASNDAEIVPKQHSNLLLSFADGSATGIVRIGDPLQTIYDVQRQCATPNWNGAGADAISMNTAHRAKKLLLALPPYWQIPDIYADPSGAISFEWYRRPKHRLILSIYGNGIVEFAGLLGVDDEVYGSARMGSSLPRTVRDHLRHLFTD